MWTLYLVIMFFILFSLAFMYLISQINQIDDNLSHSIQTLENKLGNGEWKYRFGIQEKTGLFREVDDLRKYFKLHYKTTPEKTVLVKLNNKNV